MYKFRPVADRIQLMHQLIRNRVIRTDAEKALKCSLRRNPQTGAGLVGCHTDQALWMVWL